MSQVSVFVTCCRIPSQRPANVHPLADPEARRARLRTELGGEIESWVRQGPSEQHRARGAYLAICLDLAPEMASSHPAGPGLHRARGRS